MGFLNVPLSKGLDLSWVRNVGKKTPPALSQFLLQTAGIVTEPKNSGFCEVPILDLINLSTGLGTGDNEPAAPGSHGFLDSQIQECESLPEELQVEWGNPSSAVPV